ncbi:sugar-binding domain-containing protein [Chitinophaga sp. 22321]|uniref:Glycoside hydrolase family 2 n=1 Tax=Chitinophaga hostae TaxID=2831022 RepID=A0ABS5IXG9_9BACT|nr:sugar-binding domain-containing protein [Chitinophaga hostae]MBS0027565.1 glycoside hydrolase family 2 [Chitinophaga hostae]
MKIDITGILLSFLIAGKCLGQQNPKLSDKSTVLENYHMKPIHIQSRWAKYVNPSNVMIEYPRPLLQRRNWENLNGLWDYAITDSSIRNPSTFNGSILVPYPIESSLSGVQKILRPDQCLWYRKKIQRPNFSSNERIIVNFGAVDWQATVFINNKQVGQHSGGYQSFSFDITDFLAEGNNEILVKVYDPTDQGPNPHGKQVLNPSNIYYTPSSGIWQTVWLEKVSSVHILHLKATPNIDKEELNLGINTVAATKNTTIEVVASVNGQIVTSNKKDIPAAQKEGAIVSTEVLLNIPNPRLWSPSDPFLYDLSIKVSQGKKIVDEVTSYFGMRKIDIQKDDKGADRIFLNNKYTYNLGVLDQGFWPEGLYTAPTDEALAFDIKTIKSLGFNTIRKHIKIEPERWYYHADKIGVLVWQDFVNPPHELPSGSRDIFEKEIKETIDQLYSHPSIVTWVLFNERWGSYDQRRLTKWVKNYDPSRIVNGHSGELLYVNDQLRAPSDSPWIESDIADVHSYPDPRNPPALHNKARAVGEFGGVGVSVPGHEWDDMQGWGYIQVKPELLNAQYKKMTEELKKLEQYGLSASIYTQPFDVEGEENGLLTYDREIIKIPASEIRNYNKNLVPSSTGFSLDTAFHIAANINLNDNDDRYEELLTQYKKGIRDSAFLRRVLLMAIRKKDQENATRIGNDYISNLTHPYSLDNLRLIKNITRTSKDKGFELFWKQSKKVDAELGENEALSKVKKIINSEEIIPFRNRNSNPDWDYIQKKLTDKYGDLGEELVLGKRMIYYGFESNDWENYGKYYMLYFEKALGHPSEYIVNNLTWVLYEHISNPKILEFAASVMKYTVEKSDQSPEAYDTYANLLHRINKSHEAIKWEEKAVELKKGTPGEKTFAETLQKMKSGQPTWPTNN